MQLNIYAQGNDLLSKYSLLSNKIKCEYLDLNDNNNSKEDVLLTSKVEDNKIIFYLTVDNKTDQIFYFNKENKKIVILDDIDLIEDKELEYMGIIYEINEISLSKLNIGDYLSFIEENDNYKLEIKLKLGKKDNRNILYYYWNLDIKDAEGNFVEGAIREFVLYY